VATASSKLDQVAGSVADAARPSIALNGTFVRFPFRVT
jgi:hypothetical protein